MSAAPLNLLMVTPTDYLEMWNNVEHGRVRHYAARGHRVTILHFKLNHSPRLADMVRDTVTCRVRRSERGGVHFVAVDPFFNYRAGIRLDSDARQRAGDGGGGSAMRHRLIRAAAPLAVLRDVFFSPCYLAAALRTAPRRFDVCMGIGPWGSLVGLWLRRLGRVGTLVYEDRDYDPGLMPDRLRQRYTAAVERCVMRRADLVVSVGQRLADRRRHEAGVTPIVVPNGIDYPLFAAAAARPRTPGRRLVYAGNLSPWSGVDLAIEAMPRILAALPDAHLMVIGSGLPAFEAHLRRRVSELGLGEAVSLVGSRPHEALPALLAGADVGLAASQPNAYRQYACPLKVMEYIASGLTVLTTRDTEAADIVERLGVGRAVPFDPTALAAAAVDVLRNPAALAATGRRALAQGPQMDWSHRLSREWEAIVRQRNGCP